MTITCRSPCFFVRSFSSAIGWLHFAVGSYPKYMRDERHCVRHTTSQNIDCGDFIREGGTLRGDHLEITCDSALVTRDKGRANAARQLLRHSAPWPRFLESGPWPDCLRPIGIQSARSPDKWRPESHATCYGFASRSQLDLPKVFKAIHSFHAADLAHRPHF
jgi:hypothetical protein